ncbi:hypothetical protein [Acaryochloris sp. IP29b_bin.137]|uniref:hypothetical protein n=1 Tax=Acaryochloris sp. IP29b_bin.137 TaxID=2969217 RepID=UPI00261F6564|nr:hypothetical protein [Acaryochloris sp. IP29b_bin.137]
MKETVGSLTAYFIVISVLSLISNGRVLAQGTQIHPLVWLICIVGSLLSIAYFYLGITLRQRLIDSSQLINSIIYASIVYIILNFLIISLLVGLQTGSIIQLVLGLLITWYLLNSVKRLSAQEKSKLRSK